MKLPILFIAHLRILSMFSLARPAYLLTIEGGWLNHAGVSAARVRILIFCHILSVYSAIQIFKIKSILALMEKNMRKKIFLFQSHFPIVVQQEIKAVGYSYSIPSFVACHE